MGLWCCGALAGAQALVGVVGAHAKKSMARNMSRSISAISAGFGVCCAAVFAIAINSSPLKSGVEFRKHSRNNRLTRFRSCARLICFFAIASPSLARALGFLRCNGSLVCVSRLSVWMRAATSVTQFPEKRLPAANIRLYSAGKSSRAWRGKSMHDPLILHCDRLRAK